MIGRVQEVKELNRLYARERAELVAIYGRRRVGKTYLVDETFAGKITCRTFTGRRRFKRFVKTSVKSFL